MSCSSLLAEHCLEAVSRDRSSVVVRFSSTLLLQSLLVSLLDDLLALTS